MMETSRYHKVLRVSLVITAIIFLFDGGFISPITKSLSDNTIQYLGSAASGVFAQVEPNELNTLTAELTKRERDLALREAAIQEREIESRDFGDVGDDYSTYVLSIILFILTVLIVLNYILDWMRIKHINRERQTI